MGNEAPLGPRGQGLCLAYLCWLVPLMMHFVCVWLCYLDVCDCCDVMFKGFVVFGVFLMTMSLQVEHFQSDLAALELLAVPCCFIISHVKDSFCVSSVAPCSSLVYPSCINPSAIKLLTNTSRSRLTCFCKIPLRIWTIPFFSFLFIIS